MSESHLTPGKFFGQTLNSTTYPDLLLSTMSYPARMKLAKHSHERAFFCLLLRGAYEERYASKIIDYLPGTLVFHPSDEEHQTELKDTEGHVFILELGNEWLQRLADYSLKLETTTDLHHGEMSLTAKRLYQEHKSKRFASELAVEGIVLELMSCLVNHKEKDHAVPLWLSHVIDFIRSEFQQSLTIHAIAKEFGVHPIRLSRAFRKFINMSIAEYVGHLRVEFAIAQLRQREKDLAEISLEAGFADQSHFTRTFKRLTGMTPAAYRYKVDRRL
jgi:AraC family transcriptional regulator